MADFYDADIEAKLDALEKEEDEILRMEADKAAMHESSSDEGGIADDELRAACKKVKGKITLIKQRSKMKSRQTAKSRLRTLDEVKDGLKEKGIDVNEDSLATRV